MVGPMRTIPEIILAAGGRDTVALRTGLKYDAVRKWCINGIPDRYWAALIQLLPDLSPDELFKANCAVREHAA